MIKKILTILLMSCTLPAMAFEDYMIVSEQPVKSVTVQNENIVNVKPIFTIDNQKKLLIVTPKKTGKTKVYITSAGKVSMLDIKITSKTTKLTPHEGFEYYTIDIPPEEIFIPAPPKKLGGNN